MKTLLTIVIAFALASCTKEYECTQTLKTSQASQFSPATTIEYEWKTTFKGSRKEMKQHEKDGTYLINDQQSNSITIGACVMKCR